MKVKRYPELNSLKGLITERKYTYRRLAKDADISLSALNDKLNGYTVFDTEELSRLVQVLDINHNDIIRYFFPTMLQNVS